jgi:hypothetical protein
MLVALDAVVVVVPGSLVVVELSATVVTPDTEPEEAEVETPGISVK